MGVEVTKPIMSASNKIQLSRRDFINTTVAFIGGLIATTVGIPTIAYLPCLCSEKTKRMPGSISARLVSIHFVFPSYPIHSHQSE
jgi:hypothetical protein